MSMFAPNPAMAAYNIARKREANDAKETLRAVAPDHLHTMDQATRDVLYSLGLCDLGEGAQPVLTARGRSFLGL